MPGRTHLFEGNSMRAYSSMTTAEFVAQLRDIAIKAGARALIIDQIDAIVPGSTQEEIYEQIDEAVAEARKDAFEEGRADGLQGKDDAVEAAENEMYTACIAAIEARGAEIGLDEQQIYKIVNHILWDMRP